MQTPSTWKLASLLVAHVIATGWLVRYFGNQLIKGLVGTERAVEVIFDWPGVVLSIIGIIAGVLYTKWYFAKKDYVIQDRSRFLLNSAIC